MDQEQCDHLQSARVRLTKFRYSSDQQTSESGMQQRQQQQQQTSSEKPTDHRLSSIDIFERNDHKWPWSRGDSIEDDNSQKLQKFNEQVPDSSSKQVVLNPLLLQEAANFEVAQRAVKDPFQVIWSQLAFEVDTLTYDQIVERTFDRLKFSSLRSSDNASTTKQTQSQAAANHHRRVIFENLNGHINSGEISAILGPSGVGKTSLINAICSKAKANYRGRVQLIGGSSSRMRVSVIPQKDYLMDRLTVKENLLFASRMLNPERGFDHEANILRLAKTLNLNYCLHSKAASISGGEYKRVSIAQELLKRPDILILDEPTSGLDSVNCKNLIRSLRSLIDASHRGAINPIAIVLTIHQPDIEIFHMFDHIYCMARGGRTVYEGHPSRALEVIQSQSGLGAAIGIDLATVNPANLLIEIASEFVYGPAPIEKLNRYQLKQFEVSLNSTRGLTTTLKGGQQDAVSGSWPSMANHMVPGAAATGGPADKAASITMSNGTRTTTSPSHSSYSLASIPSTVMTTTSNEDEQSSNSARQQKNGTTTTTTAAATKKKSFVRDKRLSSKVEHGGKFWHQMCLLTRRNFTADIRDPLLTGAAVMFHLVIPFVMYIAYSQKIGSAKACPVIHREMELLALASNETANKVADLQEEFTVALECSTMFFLSTYCFSLRSLLLAALSFPLSMHVLVKESRNGWYNVTAYVIAKIVSSFLTEVLLPVVSVIMIYYILDMPGSPYHWRLWAVALVMALISLVSAVQGLIWGALSMDSIQAAIFMGSASSLPLVLLSGFTARIKQMPVFMQNLSWISPYRYSSDAINIIRFGFGLCPCDSSTSDYLKTKAASFADLPDRMKPLFSFYLTNNAPDDEEGAVLNATLASTTLPQLHQQQQQQQQQIAGISYDLLLSSGARNNMLKRLESNELDLFGKMAELLSKSFTYGREINGCESVRSQLLVIGGFPEDNYLPAYFGGLAIMFILMNIILFLVVKSKVNKRV